MKSFLENLLWILVITVVIAAVLAIPTCQYIAYKTRFPEAPGWTFFFR